MNYEEIPLLNELIDLYDEGKLPEEKVYRAYPTEQHRNSNNYWWFPYQQIKAHSEIRKIAEKQFWEAVWRIK